jgi:iron complex outermembrane receptor protein
MKLSCIILLVAILNAGATGYSQSTKLNAEMADVTVKEVFKKIEDQSGYRVFYSDDLGYINKKIDIDVTGKTVEKILDEMLADSKLTYKVLENNMIFIVPENVAQGIKITGTVTDEYGEPMPGVNVVVKGSSTGVVTGIDGNYSLTVPDEDAVLVFSFMGFAKQEIVVGQQQTIQIIMEEDALQIDEVVVTALGLTREKKALGYSMTEISGEGIARANVVNPVQGLQGKVAGVQIDMGSGGPQSSQRIVIRGNTSLSGNNQPIFIIDGIIVDNEITKTDGKSDRDFGNELKSLNADDFESVSVLKGAAATALYGSRASNGVILITTKKGRKSEGFGVSVSQTLQLESVYKYPSFQNKYGMGTSPVWALNPDGSVDRNVSATSLNWGPVYDGLPYSTGVYEGVWRAYPKNLDPLFRNGHYRNTNVAVQGGTDKSTYRFSFSNMKDVGLSPNNSMARNNLTFKASQDISKFLTTEASFTYTNINSKNPTYQGGDSSPLYDFVWAVPRDYDTHYWKNNYWNANRDGYNDEDPFGYAATLFDFFENNELQKEDLYRGYIKLDINFTNWLKAVLNADMNRTHKTREKKTLAAGSSNFTGAGYSLWESRKLQYRLNGMLTANHRFGDFNLGGYVGAELYNELQSYHNSSTNNGLLVPGVFELYNSVDAATTDALASYRKKRLNSVFAAVQTDWKSQVYLEFTARNDWSSTMRYSNGSGNVSYFYPSINASWLVSETYRNRLPSLISFLKLRASYAIVGKDCDIYLITDPGTYQYYDFYADDRSGSGNYAYYKFANYDMGDLNLKPEKQQAFELGLDYRMFKNRLGVDFAYYKTNTKNQIIQLAMSAETGVSNRIINAGDIQNQGIELLFTGVPIQTSDWVWDLSLNLTRNKNKIHELADGIQKYQLPGGNEFDVEAWATVGGAYGDIYTSYTYKLDEKNNKLLAATGAWIRKGESTKIGSLQPDLLAGLNSNLSWKSLSLGITLDARFGGDIYSSTYYYGKYTGKLKSTLPGRTEETGGLKRTLSDGSVVYDGMIPDGVFDSGISIADPSNPGNNIDLSGMSYQEAYDKGYVAPLSAHTYHQNLYSWGSGIRDEGLMKCSWIALRDISLSWSVPNKWTEKLYIKDLRLSCNVRNICYLYNSLPDNVYPEALVNNYTSQFREGGGRPYSRRYGLTLSLSF